MRYLASVYSYNAKSNSGKDRALREKRYQYAMKRTAELMMDGEFIFSPITHCHPMSNRYGLPKEYGYWQFNDRNFIEASEGVIVLMMPNWENSSGVTDEIAYAKFLGKPVTFLECPDYEE